MAHPLFSRIARALSLFAALTLPAGCIIEGGHSGRSNFVDGPAQYAGCPALSASGTSGLIGLSAERNNYFLLETYTFPGYYVMDDNGPVIIDQVRTSRDEDDATFRIVSGLADSRCISFESANHPGVFLNHQQGTVYMNSATNDLAFAEDATFCPRPGLAEASGLSFESCGNPGLYLNHLDDRLYVSDEPGYEFEDDATFRFVVPRY
jgi:hypothetical protein